MEGCDEASDNRWNFGGVCGGGFRLAQRRFPSRPGYYNTELTGFSDAAAERAYAIRVAEDFCAGLNRQTRILVTVSDPHLSNVRFRCVEPSRGY